MSEQLSLPGFEAPLTRPPADGLFLAFVPPATMVPLIGEWTRQLRNEHGLRGKPLASSCLHVSLHGLGVHHGLPARLIDAVSGAVSAVSVSPFDVRFDRALSFYNKRGTKPFVLRTGGDIVALSAFHLALGEAVTKAGLGHCVSRYFTPHMTLLYDRQLVEERAIGALSWTVTEFVLVHSFIGEGRHVHLARWPLRG